VQQKPPDEFAGVLRGDNQQQSGMSSYGICRNLRNAILKWWATMSKTRPALFRGRHFQDHVIVLCVRWYLR
jgi:hypothetical protein